MKKMHIILLALITLKFVLQFFAIDSGYELHRDEYLHLDLGNHLAWGYSSVPPMTGFISFIIKLLGNSVFWVKFFPALFGALIIVVVWKTVEELKGGWFALILASVSVIFSVMLRINTLYQPNSLDFLIWATVSYTLVKYINSEQNKWLYFTSLCLAFGILNKYNIGFLILGLLPSILLTKHRKLFTNKHFYYSLLLTLILILPNILWQIRHDFPVLHHLKELTESQLVNIDRIDFLKEQFYFFSSSFLVIVLAFISFFTYSPFKHHRIFFYTYFFTLVIFIFFRAKSYYTIGLYPVLLAFGSVYLEKLLQKGWWRILRPVSILAVVGSFIPVYPLILPVLSPGQIQHRKETFDKLGLTRWEDGKIHHLPQDYADMLGWKELAGIIDSAFLLIDDKNNTIVHCDNYGQAGAINFYSKQQYTDAVSMNADYIDWYFLDEYEIKNVILVKEVYDTDKSREKEKVLFERIIYVGEIKNENARERGTRVYLLEGARQSINEILREEIAYRKTKN